ncbi:hypothetical protein Tco_1154121 [Tanacetum coccineum]
MEAGLMLCRKNVAVQASTSMGFGCLTNGAMVIGLQVKQNKGGIFISQDKYVAEILKKFDLVNVKGCHHYMEDQVAFDKDEEAFDCNSKDFSSQCCQENLQVSQGQTKLGIMVSRIPFHFGNALSNSDYGGSPTLTGSTTGGCQFLVKDYLMALYALTANPTIYDSLVKQFWQSAIANTRADGSLEINATIDTIRYTISEASIRDSLQLDDATGITMLPNADLFEGMGHIGYPTDGTFTFWKSFFTPQWRYLVHHLLHCISSKSGGWDQFGSNIATALICLSTGQEHAAQAQSQPSSSSPTTPPPPPIPTPTPPPIPTPTPPPPPIPTPTPPPPPIPTPTPPPIPNTLLHTHHHHLETELHQDKTEAQGRISQDDPSRFFIQDFLSSQQSKGPLTMEEETRERKETKVRSSLKAWTFQKMMLCLKVNTTSEINTDGEINTAGEIMLLDLIRAKLKANAELSKSMLGSELQGIDFAKRMVDLVNQRKKFFAEERAKAKRNKPMTQSQLKTYMMNYLKNQGTMEDNQMIEKLCFEKQEEFGQACETD